MVLRLLSLALFVAALARSIPCGNGLAQVRINSIAKLYALSTQSDNHVHMAPGEYTIDMNSKGDFGGEWPQVASGFWPFLFDFSGDTNIFDFTDVTIYFNTSILAEADSVATGSIIGITGANNHFESLTWIHLPKADGDFGYFPDPSGGTVVKHSGTSNVMSGATIRSAGSSVYGLGSIYGQEGTSTLANVVVRKLSCYLISGAQDAVLKNSHLDHSGHGHVLYFSGNSKGSVISNCIVQGETRSTQDLRASGVNGVDRNGVPFRVTYGGTATSVALGNPEFFTEHFTTDALDQCHNLGNGDTPSIRSGFQFSLTRMACGLSGQILTLSWRILSSLVRELAWPMAMATSRGR